MLIDSHCHLDHLNLTDTDLPTILAEAKSAGIESILSPGINLEHFPKILSIAKQYQNIYVSVGVHPTENVAMPTADELMQYASEPLVKAIGETGLDYAECAEDMTAQKKQCSLFELHVQIAKQIKKPLIIHSRAADKDLLHILRSNDAKSLRGVLHCFTGNWEMAKAALDLNFYISFAGIVTFKNAEMLREVAKKVPIDKILIETDAPWLAPVPMRGKSNVPAYLKYTAELIANLRNQNFEEFATQTSENFWRLF